MGRWVEGMGRVWGVYERKRLDVTSRRGLSEWEWQDDEIYTREV